MKPASEQACSSETRSAPGASQSTSSTDHCNRSDFSRRRGRSSMRPSPSPKNVTSFDVEVQAAEPERMTIDALAQAAGTTTRNVRAYQTRGLLPAPLVVGRVGYYGDAHLERLRLIANLQERGYSLAAIADLL